MPAGHNTAALGNKGNQVSSAFVADEDPDSGLDFKHTDEQHVSQPSPRALKRLQRATSAATLLVRARLRHAPIRGVRAAVSLSPKATHAASLLPFLLSVAGSLLLVFAPSVRCLPLLAN